MKNLPVLPWLDPAEQEEGVETLLKYELIKYSNGKEFVNSNGSYTDIYINLRHARSNPDALKNISHLYTNPLRRLGVDRFVEVPDSVSCFAGIISAETGIPYITVRKEPKIGRVSHSSIIGHVQFGDRLCMIDDVISDGTAKIDPYRACISAGLELKTLVVLVDREQGWREKFMKEKINLHVWSGMALHDIRRHLISTFHVMSRCDHDREEKNPLILALDGKSWQEILPIVEELRTTGCVFKVNDILFNEGAKWLLPNLSVYGRVMVDCKGHDTPNTLKNISSHLLKCPPWAVTVHGSGGEEMVRAVVDALRGTPTKVFVVTLLTSLDEKNSREIYRRIPHEEVIALSRIAYRAGAHGIISSPEELGMLRQLYPAMILATPGMRSDTDAKNDQKRTGTLTKTKELGANYLIVGRPVMNTPNPAKEAIRILTEDLNMPILDSA